MSARIPRSSSAAPVTSRRALGGLRWRTERSSSPASPRTASRASRSEKPLSNTSVSSTRHRLPRGRAAPPRAARLSAARPPDQGRLLVDRARAGARRRHGDSRAREDRGRSGARPGAAVRRQARHRAQLVIRRPTAPQRSSPYARRWRRWPRSASTRAPARGRRGSAVSAPFRRYTRPGWGRARSGQRARGRGRSQARPRSRGAARGGHVLHPPPGRPDPEVQRHARRPLRRLAAQAGQPDGRDHRDAYGVGLAAPQLGSRSGCSSTGSDPTHP